MSNHRNTSKEIRRLRIFSGSDQFMQGGHQIINSNRAAVGPKRKNSDWAMSDIKVQKLLSYVFPKARECERQRGRAGFWARVIHLYFRLGMSFGDVAVEMKVGEKKIRNTIYRINRVLHGQTCNGCKRKTESFKHFSGSV